MYNQKQCVLLFLLCSFPLAILSLNTPRPSYNDYKNGGLHLFIESILKGYHKTARPNTDVNKDVPVKIQVDLNILSIGKISAADMNYETVLFLHQHWREPRLTYLDYAGPLHIESYAQHLWLPDIFFSNAVKGKEHDITVKNKLLWLYPDGTVHYSLKLSLQLSCHLVLKSFPLDRQTCTLELSSFSYPNHDLDLVWKHDTVCRENVVYHNKTLNEFDMRHIITKESTCTTYRFGNYSCLTVHFLLERNIGFYIVYAYFPSVLIVSVSWLAFLIDFQNASARVSLGLLSMLTLMTQGAAIVQTLPKISDIKAIEVWMFTCLAFVISSLLEFVLVSSLCRGEKETSSLKNLFVTLGTKRSDVQASKAELAAKEQCFRILKKIQIPKRKGYIIDGLFFVGYPCVFIMFNLLYWSHYSSQDFPNFESPDKTGSDVDMSQYCLIANTTV